MLPEADWKESRRSPDKKHGNLSELLQNAPDKNLRLEWPLAPIAGAGKNKTASGEAAWEFQKQLR